MPVRRLYKYVRIATLLAGDAKWPLLTHDLISCISLLGPHPHSATAPSNVRDEPTRSPHLQEPPPGAGEGEQEGEEGAGAGASEDRGKTPEPSGAGAQPAAPATAPAAGEDEMMADVAALAGDWDRHSHLLLCFVHIHH
jgi:hypothetical protein